MLINNSDNEKLFSKLVPVSVKDVYSNQSRTSRLFLTMEWQEAAAGMYNRKVLSISLTDNDDPFFLYNLQLSEEDFQVLKANQDLVTNFSSFPQHIIEYIEKCLLEEKNPQPKFLLVFNCNDKLGNVATPSQLDIVETNQFKNLTYLSLKFIAATETAVRQYLASNFRCLKEEKRQLQNNLAFMERDLKDKLAACQATLTSKVQELGDVIKQLKIELNEKDHKYQTELQEERDRLINRYKDEMNRLEKEIKEKECNLRKEIQQYESRVNVLDTFNKELNDKNFMHESTIRELRSKILSLEDETKCLKDNLQSYKRKYDHLQSEIKEKQSHMRQQEEIISDLQQELRSKEQSILKLKDRIESEIEQKKSFENELENVKFHLDMSEKTRQVLENDKERLNEVIVGLQEKSKEITKEEKCKSQLVSKYKKTIEEKDLALLNIKQQINDLTISLQNKTDKVINLTEKQNYLQDKLKELEGQVTNKDNVIKWLNRQLTDNCIVAQYIPPSHFTSPSALAQKQLAKINSGNSPPAVTGENVRTKSVRIEATPPVCKQSSSIPSQFYKTAGIDSAYYTTSLHSNQATPEILAGNHNMNFISSNLEIDQEALSAAFRDEGCTIKHSTAKKPTRPINSTTPKTSKKR